MKFIPCTRTREIYKSECLHSWEVSIIDKTEIKSEMIKKRIHNFYCDNCGEYLGAVKEYDDGYYH